MVAVNLLQVNKLKEVIQEADPNVFILITDAQEVIGQGFTQPIIPTEVCEQLKDKEYYTRGRYRDCTQSISKYLSSHLNHV